MKLSPRLVKLVRDPAVTPDALRLILYVVSQGDGWHEIRADEFRMLLRCRSDRPIYEARNIAERYGLEWKQGGRAHANAYRYLGPGAEVSDTSATETTYPENTSAQEPSYDGYLGAGDEVSPPTTTTPPVPPPPARAREDKLSDRVEGIIDESEDLKGCRDSIRDYVRKRVDPENQASYVYRVIASLQGTDEWMWRDRRGGKLTEGRTKVLAAALNELLAGDEVGTHFPEPPGGFGNLRSKVRYLVAASLGVERDATKSERQRQTAAEEEAELVAKREAVRSRVHNQDREAQVRLEREAGENAAKLTEARAWLEGQTAETQGRVAVTFAAGLKKLGWKGDPDRAPKFLAEPALLGAIDRVRGDTLRVAS